MNLFKKLKILASLFFCKRDWFEKAIFLLWFPPPGKLPIIIHLLKCIFPIKCIFYEAKRGFLVELSHHTRNCPQAEVIHPCYEYELGFDEKTRAQHMTNIDVVLNETCWMDFRVGVKWGSYSCGYCASIYD